MLISVLFALPAHDMCPQQADACCICDIRCRLTRPAKFSLSAEACAEVIYIFQSHCGHCKLLVPHLCQGKAPPLLWTNMPEVCHSLLVINKTAVLACPLLETLWSDTAASNIGGRAGVSKWLAAQTASTADHFSLIRRRITSALQLSSLPTSAIHCTATQTNISSQETGQYVDQVQA